VIKDLKCGSFVLKQKTIPFCKYITLPKEKPFFVREREIQTQMKSD
jgi:hypothetical protein